MSHLENAFPAKVYRKKPRNFAPSLEVAACYVRCGDRFLFLHRVEGEDQGSTWGVPAGKMESGESPLKAVIREVFEETGITLDASRLRDLGPLYVRYPHLDFVYHVFGQDFAVKPDVTLAPREHQAFCWVEAQEALSLPLIAGAAETLHQFLSLSSHPKLPERGFYFIRHGETEVNADPHTKRVDYDLPLNARGRDQAEAAREVVARLPIDTVYFSPIQRAEQTKSILLTGLDRSQISEGAFSECQAEQWMTMVRLEEGSGYQYCSGVNEFLSRVSHGINRVLQSEDGTPLIVAHGGVHWALCYLLQIESHPWKIGNCEMVHFEPQGGGKWAARVL